MLNVKIPYCDQFYVIMLYKSHQADGQPNIIITGITMSTTNLPQKGGMAAATAKGTNLKALNTDLLVSLDGGAKKEGPGK